MTYFLSFTGALPCPTCREVTPLTNQGLNGLKTDFKISKITDFLQYVKVKAQLCDICRTVKQDSSASFFCRDCNKHFCDDCIFRHKNTEVFDNHLVKELASDKPMKSVCKEHDKEMEQLRYFCQSCETPICGLCAMTEHMLHNLTDLDTGKARFDRVKKLRILRDKVGAKIEMINTFLEKLKGFEGSLKTSHKDTQIKIRERATEMIAHIKQEEKALLESLAQQYTGKMDGIRAETINLTDFHGQLVTLHKSAEKAIDTDEEGAFFELSNDLIRELKRVSQINFLDPDDFTEVKAKFELTLPKAVPSLGHLGEENVSSNLKFVSRIPIQLVSKVTNANLDWPCDVAFLPDGGVIVADTENYQLKIVDRKGSLRESFGVGEVKPAGVAVTKVRTIAVTDILERCVKIFSDHGQKLFEFGHYLFHSPAGIAVNSLGEYIVSDIGHNCVTTHDSQGKLLARLGSQGTGETTFDGPWYVATNDHNDIIVSDMGNHCVKVFDSKLNLLCKIENPDATMCPSGIDVDLQGNLLVCDSGNNVVSMYTPDGHLIDHILSEDDGIDNPHGVAVGESGRLVVTQCCEAKLSSHHVRVYQLYE